MTLLREFFTAAASSPPPPFAFAGAAAFFGGAFLAGAFFAAFFAGAFLAMVFLMGAASFSVGSQTVVDLVARPFDFFRSASADGGGGSLALITLPFAGLFFAGAFLAMALFLAGGGAFFLGGGAAFFFAGAAFFGGAFFAAARAGISQWTVRRGLRLRLATRCARAPEDKKTASCQRREAKSPAT